MRVRACCSSYSRARDAPVLGLASAYGAPLRACAPWYEAAMIRTVALTLVTLALALPSSARAAEPTATGRARQLFEEGRELFRRRDYEGARHKFEAARTLK